MNTRRRIGALGGATAALSGSFAAVSAHGTDAGDFWGGFVIGLALTLLVAALLISLRGRRSDCGFS